MCIDVDSHAVPRLRKVWTVLRMCDLRPRSIECHRTRRGWHLLIVLTRTLLPSERVALQAVLGSDPWREALNLMRVLSIRKAGAPDFWINRWNLLYRSKAS